MNLDDLLNRVPVLKHWTVRYDGIFEMPSYIQGEMVNTFGSYEKGSSIVIDDIISLDLRSNVVTTDLGEVFVLVGSGNRMMLTEHTVPDKNTIWDLNKNLTPQDFGDEEEDD